MPPKELSEKTTKVEHQDLPSATNLAFEGYSLAGRCGTPMALPEFRERSVGLLAKLGPKADNFNASDIVKLMDDPTIRGRDALALATLYELVHYNSPDGKAQLAVHSRADISALTAQKPTGEQFQKLLEASKSRNFDIADQNRDRRLDETEIRQNAQFLDLLKSFPNLRLEHGRNDGTLVKKDIDLELDRKLGQLFVADNFDATQSILKERLEGAISHDLYADKKNPLKSIKVDAVHQGLTGNCYFEAVLAAQANQDPRAIRDAIKDNGDGTFTVTFRGDRTHPVKINAPTEAELALYNGGSIDGMWPAVMEKAFAKYVAEYHRKGDGSRTDMDLTNGGKPAAVIRLLTGRDARDIYNDGEKAGIILDALKEGKLLSAAFAADDKDRNIYAAHAYTIIDYKPEWWLGGTITLRNPWGDTKEKGGATIKMSYLEFMARSNAVTVEDELEIPPLSMVPKFAQLGVPSGLK